MLRNRTDSYIDQLKKWTDIYIPETKTHLTSENSLRRYLFRHRRAADTGQLIFEDTVIFFTNLNRELLNGIAKTVDGYQMDRELVAFNDTLVAGEMAGAMRALGAGFFAPCYFSDANRKWFTWLDTRRGILLNQACIVQ